MPKRTSKSSGRNNPGTRYPSLDDDYFGRVDTLDKAYLLGWLASDGSIRPDRITLAIHARDAHFLGTLRDLVCRELPVRKKGRLAVLSVSSTRIARDVCRHLDIEPGKKSRLVAFPELDSDELGWAFLRGFFDGGGCVHAPSAKLGYPRCDIATSSERMRSGIKHFCGIRCSESESRLYWSHSNALDFMSKLYDGADLALTRKRDRYLDWCTWVPSLSGNNRGRGPIMRFTRTHRDAVPPIKERASDSGFDLTVIRVARRIGSTTIYGTGLKIEPDHGWYFDVVPRSSIIKTGYMLANSVGVIDRAYRGEILVPLVKVDPGKEDLLLPARVVQLVPRPIVHMQVMEVAELCDTTRGEGGFGSTGR